MSESWFVYKRVRPGVERIVARVTLQDDREGFEVAVWLAKRTGRASEVTVDRYPPAADVDVLNPPRSETHRGVALEVDLGTPPEGEP